MTKTVKTPFDYNYDNSTTTHFEAGQTLPPELENDPYALSFTTRPPYVPPKPGTPEAMLEAYNRRKRAELRAAADTDAAEEAAAEKAKADEIERLQAVVARQSAVYSVASTETEAERAAAQVRTMTYSMPQDRDEAAAAAKPAVAPDQTPVPITTKPAPPPISDASLDRARAEMQQAAKRKRA